jgi:hypothetical protein
MIGILKQKSVTWQKSKTDILRILYTAIRITDSDTILLTLKDSLKNTAPIAAESVTAVDEESAVTSRAIIEQAGVKFLDPFEVCTYILLTVFLHRQAQIWKLLTPGIGTNSCEQVFSILNHTKMILSTTAPTVTPLLASFLVHYFAPFAGDVEGCVIEKVLDCKDPFDPELRARIFIGEEEKAIRDEVAVIEANIDDMTPEILGYAMQMLLEKGALDYTVTPVHMKKGRPGFQVQVLCRPAQRAEIEEFLLFNTSTFGVRTSISLRRILDRSVEYFDSSYGRVRIKKGFYKGKCLRSVPEFEDIAALSKTRGIPLVTLYADVVSEIEKKSRSLSIESSKECQ